MKKSEKTEHTVARIIEAATSEFGKYGYAGGTINRICQAGINKGLIYHNFSGKDALYLRCLNHSCALLMQFVQERNGTRNLERYMAVRMDFFRTHPNEAHIFFEAMLNPPPHLTGEVSRALADFNALNERMYGETLDALELRDGISREDAFSYFHTMQLMLNGYFSSPALQGAAFEERVEKHERIVPRLLDCMLYGIAKEGK